MKNVIQIYITVIRHIECRKYMECGDIDNFNLLRWAIIGEKHVMVWICLKDQYNNINETWEPAESLSSGQ